MLAIIPAGENWRDKMFQLLDTRSSATKLNSRVMNRSLTTSKVWK
uniref:Uncharacterized protein n=1 Tax=Arundo donax TaxID=35708 RepID=A0A0A9DAH6_ARUDO